MFLNRNKKNNVYPCKPQFYYIKVGSKGSKLYRHVFVMCISLYCILFINYIVLSESAWYSSSVREHIFIELYVRQRDAEQN